ncbi:MAG: hypothetical protein IJ028_06885 [Alistipes sp.]|nr:hypothetical protein [Alistipes sp.]MBQ8916885.1 hypothetical protein [Alistipes sp.]
MLQLRRITLLLLTCAYLVATGAGAVLSLCCPCVEMHQHTPCCCCHATQHHVETDMEADALFKAVCCDDLHSNEQRLYTAGEEDALRRMLRTWPSFEFVVASVNMTEGLTCDEQGAVLLARLKVPQLTAAWIASKALRAPPVMA